MKIIGIKDNNTYLMEIRKDELKELVDFSNNYYTDRHNPVMKALECSYVNIEHIGLEPVISDVYKVAKEAILNFNSLESNFSEMFRKAESLMALLPKKKEGN